jgi:hypothetical protein
MEEEDDGIYKNTILISDTLSQNITFVPLYTNHIADSESTPKERPPSIISRLLNPPPRGKYGYVYFKIGCHFRPERQQIILPTIIVPFNVSYFKRLELYVFACSSTCSNTGKQTREV